MTCTSDDRLAAVASSTCLFGLRTHERRDSQKGSDYSMVQYTLTVTHPQLYSLFVEVARTISTQEE